MLANETYGTQDFARSSLRLSIKNLSPKKKKQKKTLAFLTLNQGSQFTAIQTHNLFLAKILLTIYNNCRTIHNVEGAFDFKCVYQLKKKYSLTD